MSYLFTSESVSEGHPDKVADQIADAILDEFLSLDKKSKVACEVMVTTGQVIISGEVKSEAYIDIQKIARTTINNIGYTKSEYGFQGDSCGVLTSIHEQSPDINRVVDREETKKQSQGAGDQGIMFGYACNETKNFMPLTLEIAHLIVKELAAIRKENKKMRYLRPDAKSQVTIEYNEDKTPRRIHTIVISTQHDEFEKPKSNDPKDIREAERKMHDVMKDDVKKVLIPRMKKMLDPEVLKLFDEDKLNILLNPTGKFVVGGPHCDTGVTGRKIIVDTYGGKAPHGGGAFSGKDPSKVDRSAAYAARHIAKNLVAAGVAEEVLVQVSYAIGIDKPINLSVNTFGTSKARCSDSELSVKVGEIFDMRPAAIIERLKLLNPIYFETAKYGHFGREPQVIQKVFKSHMTNKVIDLELFTWEKLDYVDAIRAAIPNK